MLQSGLTVLHGTALVGGEGGGRASLMNVRLLRWGVPEEVCHDAQNPGKFNSTCQEEDVGAACMEAPHCGVEICTVPDAGFHDPFDPVRTITLDNPQYRCLGVPLMQGKLDWLLLRRLHVLGTSIGNHDYSASDHKWLCADVSFT